MNRYLELADWVLEDAIQSAKDDFEWEDGQQEQGQQTRASTRSKGKKYARLKTEDDYPNQTGEAEGDHLV